MDEEEKLKQIIKNLYEGFDGAALISNNKDGSVKVAKEKPSEYSFVVFDHDKEFKGLLDKLKDLGYSIDLDTVPGLIPGKDLIRVDVSHKTVTRAMVVSINHYKLLQDSESILLEDVLTNFDEIVMNTNKELVDSLYQFRKRKMNQQN